MGRWTLDHYDEVLRNKMKSLVNGACKRIQLEEGEPSISYEAFVENLDEGDSFTTSLIDILVREMAERRTRPEESDRRLISERTAKALRLQSTPLQVYRSRPYRTLNRRYNPSFNPSDYPTAPPDVMELSDTEDDFGATTGANAVEGARLPTELFDAYSTFHTLDGALSHSGEPAVIPTAGRPLTPIEPETVTSPRPYSPPIIPPSFRSRLYSNPESSTAVSGRPARRPNRTRTSDFNDFTTRRRSTIRENVSQGIWEPIRREDSSDSLTMANPWVEVDSLRRISSRRHEVLHETPWDMWAESRRSPRAGGESATSQSNAAGVNNNNNTSGQSSSQLWFSLTSGQASSQASTSDSGADGNRNALERRPIVAPRLRRGGVRAPESLLSRYASSSPPPNSLPLSAVSSSSSSSHPYTRHRYQPPRRPIVLPPLRSVHSTSFQARRLTPPSSRSSSSSAQETEEQQSQAQHVHDHEHDENHHDVADQNVPILQVPANREHDHNHLQHPQESQRSDSRGLQRALADMLADVGESSARNTEDERRTQLPTPRSISPNDHDEHA